MEVEEDQQPLCATLSNFHIYGWKPEKSLSIDDNFLDLLVLVTRNSVCHAAGHMGCILARPLTTDPVEQHVGDQEAASPVDTSTPLSARDNNGGQQELLDSILVVANNQPLYKENSSDIHAEVSAIGQCAKSGRSTEGCTAYITMPPCKNCLGALVVAGVQRIVFLRSTPDYLRDVAQRFGIKITGATKDIDESRKERLETIIANYNREHEIDDKVETIRLREQRKLDKQERQKKRKLILITKKNIHPSQLGPSS